MRLPPMAVVEQRRAAPRIEDAAARVRGELERIGAGRLLPPGGVVAITAGSRHIQCLPDLLRALAAFVRRRGCEPLVVPAMGSHGGATAEGQKKVLAAYGVTESSIGVPIRSGMDVRLLSKTSEGVQVLGDSAALAADAIIVVNRVKPHTRFFGAIESGLTKMTLVGLGNHAGAAEYHRAAARMGFDRVAETAFQIWQRTARIAFGVAIVENCKGQPAHIEAAVPDDFLQLDRRLLGLARDLMLRLPFRKLDLLIVDRMGKDISGTGMDVNVIGAREGSEVAIAHIFVRDLTDASEGNAHGIGFASVTTRRLVEKMDREVTLANARTALRQEAAVVPPAFETDRQCLERVLSRLRRPPRVVQIADTLHLERCRVSADLLRAAAGRKDIAAVTQPAEVVFDEGGNLAPW